MNSKYFQMYEPRDCREPENAPELQPFKWYVASINRADSKVGEQLGALWGGRSSRCADICHVQGKNSCSHDSLERQGVFNGSGL